MSDEPKAPPPGAGPLALEPLGAVDAGEAFRRLFDAHPVPMAIWDPSTGLILAANDAALAQYGYERSEIVGLPVDRIVHPDDQPRLAATVPRLGGGYAGTEPFRHLRRDGSVIEVEMSGHPIEYRGRPARLVLAFDVTEQRRLEEQLRQAQKMEAAGRLAGSIAHDFNNLLMAIMGFSELLLERLPADGEEHDAAEQIRAAGERAAALTAQLLAFSRPKGANPVTVDLNETVRSLEPALRQVVGPHVDVRVDAQPAPAFVRIDRDSLEQVLVSCAVNARDAMPDGGSLTVATSEVSSVAARALGGIIADTPHVMLSVSDTGVGMTADVRDRAFDPFFTTKQPGSATGLGLAMVYAAIKQAGGRVRLESVPGRGSTIRIFLPLVEIPPAVESGPPSPVAAARNGAAATILVAEDEPAVRALVERVLTGAGHRVLAAADGTAALDIAARHEGPIDLLLTDIVMPGPSGIETARRMRALRPDIRVLFMSGWAAEALSREGIEEADLQLLAKPFSVSELTERVAAALASPTG